ncbi:hypothetical protein MRX96_052407 [Rhipicephalus microplus]
MASTHSEMHLGHSSSTTCLEMDRANTNLSTRLSDGSIQNLGPRPRTSRTMRNVLYAYGVYFALLVTRAHWLVRRVEEEGLYFKCFHLKVCVEASLVEEEDDDSSVASSPFDDGGFLDSLDFVDGAAGDGQESSSAAVSAVVEG